LRFKKYIEVFWSKWSGEQFGEQFQPEIFVHRIWVFCIENHCFALRDLALNA